MSDEKDRPLTLPDGSELQAISLWEPWASAIAAGLKSVETRHWKPPKRLVGQRIAIHAAKRKFGIGSETADIVRSLTLPSYRRLSEHLHGADPEDWYGYPLGCVVATAELTRVYQTNEVQVLGHDVGVAVTHDGSRLSIGTTERHLGDYSPGRYAWLLSDVTALPDPIPAVGHQGFWSWSA